MAFSHEIGTTQVNRVTLSSLGVPPPMTSYSPGAERRGLGDGNERELGWPVVTWSWLTLPHAARDALRVYCTGPSAAAHIYTPLNDNDDAYYELSCKVVWPAGAEQKRHTSHDRQGFTLQFKVLEDETA